MSDRMFADRLYGLMQERRVDVIWLAKRVDLNKNTIYRYLNAQRQPPLPVLRRIKAALICTWDELLGG